MLPPIPRSATLPLVPFLFCDATSSERYQQVYAASDFSQIASGGGLITELRFALHDQNPGFAVTLGKLQIDLSTTAKLPDALSPLFPQNLGADALVVLAPGPFRLSRAGTLAFPLPLPLTHPSFH